MPYVEAQTLLDEGYPEGGRYYWKSQNVDGLGDELLISARSRGRGSGRTLRRTPARRCSSDLSPRGRSDEDPRDYIPPADARAPG
jgi:hypothetical protein